MRDRPLLSPSHLLLDQPNNYGDHGAANSTTRELTDDRAHVHSATGRSGAQYWQQCAEYLTEAHATHRAGDAVAERPEAHLLPETTRDISADGTTDNLNK